MKSYPSITKIRLFLICTALAFGVQIYAAPEDPNRIAPLFEGLPVPGGISVKDASGSAVDLTAKLLEEPSILVFYRGGWCPYCNQQLSDLARVESELTELGFQILAISPDAVEILKAFTDNHDFSYQLLSDSGHHASDAFGLTFKVSDEMNQMLLNYGIDIEKAAGNTARQLPVPGVFVIADGIIQFAYVNPDYKVRLDGEVLLAAAKSVTGKK